MFRFRASAFTIFCHEPFFRFVAALRISSRKIARPCEYRSHMKSTIIERSVASRNLSTDCAVSSALGIKRGLEGFGPYHTSGALFGPDSEHKATAISKMGLNPKPRMKIVSVSNIRPPFGGTQFMDCPVSMGQGQRTQSMNMLAGEIGEPSNHRILPTAASFGWTRIAAAADPQRSADLTRKCCHSS